MIPEGKTAINLKFDGRLMNWRFVVSRREQGTLVPEQWEFELTHDELKTFSERLCLLLDDIEQQVGSVLRGS